MEKKMLAFHMTHVQTWWRNEQLFKIWSLGPLALLESMSGMPVSVAAASCAPSRHEKYQSCLSRWQWMGTQDLFGQNEQCKNIQGMDSIYSICSLPWIRLADFHLRALYENYVSLSVSCLSLQLSLNDAFKLPHHLVIIVHNIYCMCSNVISGQTLLFLLGANENL